MNKKVKATVVGGVIALSVGASMGTAYAWSGVFGKNMCQGDGYNIQAYSNTAGIGWQQLGCGQGMTADLVHRTGGPIVVKVIGWDGSYTQRCYAANTNVDVSVGEMSWAAWSEPHC